MSNQVQLTGAITAGPPGCGDCGDGSALINMALSFKGGCCGKPYNAAVGGQPRLINSVGYVTITSIGTGGDVTAPDTLILWSNTPMTFELTTKDGVGGFVVSEIPIDGLFIIEFPAVKTLTLLRVKGAGTINYFASGQA